MKKQRVLLTGAGGYLGSILTPMLLNDGYQVTAFDKFYFGKQTLDSVADHPSLQIVDGDIRTLDPALFDNVDVVIQMAALSNDPACELDPSWTESVNRDAALRLAQLSKQRGVSRFIFSSSCSVYGAGGEELLTEESDLQPVSLYAKAKVETDTELMRMADQNFHPVSLRKATLFGLSPRMRFDLAINIMTMHAVTKGHIYVTGGGQQWRPFVHVKDAARAYQLFLEVPEEKISGKIFNLSAFNYQIITLAQSIGQYLGDVRIHTVPDDPDLRNYRVSGKHIETELGFTPTCTLEDGIEEIAEAIRDGQLGDLDCPRYYTLRTLKEVLEKPARVGGEPIRSTFLPFALPKLGKQEEEEVLDTLRSGWITTGPKTKRFEDMCREYLGSRHALALNSCTGALHVSLAAASIGTGDEVITTPISWPATANVVILQGAKPVFVDVESDTLNLDTSKIEAAITPRTKAIMPVHMAGQPCDLTAVRDIAQRHNLMVIEDAAHAIGAEFEGRKIGGTGKAVAFSFYPIKNMTTIEGGLLTSDDDEFIEKARVLSLHGISKDAWKRYSAEGSLHWQLLYPGFKYNMTDIQASLGLHQLPRLDEFIEIREHYAGIYDQAFSDVPAIQPLSRRLGLGHAHHLYVVLLQLEHVTITRDEFALALKAENIGTGFHFVSMHLQPYYQTNYGLKPDDLPVANWVSQRLISLPLYPKMTKQNLQDVIKAVKKVVYAYRANSSDN